MSNQNNSFNPDRNLVDVFKELQQKKAEDTYLYQHGKSDNNSRGNNEAITTYFSSNKKVRTPYSYGRKPKVQKLKNYSTKTFSYSKLSVGIIIIILIVSLALLFISYSFTTYGLEEEVAQVPEALDFETNQNALNVTQIIAGNLDTGTIKETLNEERDVNFSIKYQSVDNLPKGEEEITQQGANGKNKVVAVRTYKDSELIEENVIETTTIKDPVEQIVNIGTSEFLSKYKVHLGDIMYVISDTPLKEKADKNSKDLITIPATLDVKLVELSGDWSKVTYDDKTGYVQNTFLTSAAVAPEMVEKARVQRILRDVKIDMPLNKKSGLAASDYEKMLSGQANDTNKIFEDNYRAFFEIEQKYNINGVFLAALAIHESGWGTSQIARDKKNLFGYGANDSNPYEDAFQYNDYKEGLENVAKNLVKRYINPKDTEIYDNEKATADYYNGSTLEGVNKRYSTDPDWHKKVFNYMQMLYNKLQ